MSSEAVWPLIFTTVCSGNNRCSGRKSPLSIFLWWASLIFGACYTLDAAVKERYGLHIEWSDRGFTVNKSRFLLDFDRLFYHICKQFENNVVWFAHLALKLHRIRYFCINTFSGEILKVEGLAKESLLVIVPNCQPFSLFFLFLFLNRLSRILGFIY